ncbi:MAG: hypothetical protein Q8L36_02975 [bacterium]|nr:hypothetical protein [bacterium]
MIVLISILVFLSFSLFVYKVFIGFLKRKEVKSISDKPIAMPFIKGQITKAEKKWDDKLWFTDALEKSLITSGLPIIAIIISIYSWVSNNESNKFTEKNLLPQFEVRAEYEGIDNGLITNDASESIIFENKGGLCYSLKAKTISFIQVAITENKKTELFFLPISMYFPFVKTDKCEKVELSDHNTEESYDDNNYAKIINLDPKMDRDYSRLIFYNPISFVELSYQDTFGNSKFEYFVKTPFEGVKKINNSEWIKFWEIYNNNRKIFDFALGDDGYDILDYVETIRPDYEYIQK